MNIEYGSNARYICMKFLTRPLFQLSYMCNKQSKNKFHADWSNVHAAISLFNLRSTKLFSVHTMLLCMSAAAYIHDKLTFNWLSTTVHMYTFKWPTTGM